MMTADNRRARQHRLRLAGRTLALVGSAALAWPWAEAWGTGLPLAAISPFVALGSALALRAAGVLALAGLPVLALAWLHPRWFCRHACPVGFAQDLLGLLNARWAVKSQCRAAECGRRLSAPTSAGPVSNPGRDTEPAPRSSLNFSPNPLHPAAGKRPWFHWPHIGRWLALLTLGGACAGYPLFLWLDPLAIFNGFFSAWHRPVTAAGVCAGLALPALLLFDLWRPKAWCMRLCPLGAMQELLVVGRRMIRSPAHDSRGAETAVGRAGQPAEVAAANPPPPPFTAAHAHHGLVLARRSLLAGCLGAAGALAVRAASGGSQPPLRPPGAAGESRFTGLCVRCGNCIRVCPTRILQAGGVGHGLAGWLAPVMSFANGYCNENCHACGRVCPSGAIARLTLAEKRRRVIGPAVVNLDECLLANGRECTACIEACPYQALAIRSTDGGFSSLPGVDVTKCTGCGACETVCPVRPQRAIRVLAKPGRL